MASAVLNQIKSFDLKYGKTYMAPLVITTIVIGAHLSFGILTGYEKFAAAIAASFITELLLAKFVFDNWKNPASAYISGISVGILVRSTYIWPYIFCSVLSIMSKYVMRYKGRHLWNPSNFGIVMLIILASDSVGILSVQWGNNLWAMLVIWIIGFFSVYKAGRFHISATYLATFILFSLLRSQLTQHAFLAEIAPATGPMYQLFTLFMITDPKTTVSSRKGQYVVVILIGALEMVFRMYEFVYAPFYALFILGPISLFIEQWWKERNANGETQLNAQTV